jgi:hypothetical protein
VLGSGLVGVVNVVELEGGTAVALKRARARVAFFREALRVEPRTTELLASSGLLTAARVIDHGDHWIAKELVTGPTLAELLVRGDVGAHRASALEGVLDVVAHALRAWGIALDVSPKNLAWQNGWVLLDAGPKLKVGDVERIASARSFDAYVEAYRAKLAAGPSTPSAVGAPASAEERLDTPEEHAFVRDLWRWFPLDPKLDPSSFLVSIDERAESDEIAVLRTASGAMRASPGVLDTVEAAARDSWPSDARADHEASPSVQLAARARSAIGRLYAAHRGEDPPLPKATVRPYRHWRDVTDPRGPHDPIDLFCHEVVPVPNGVADGARVRLPTPTGTFAELGIVPGRRDATAWILVPGFRAGVETTHALLNALRARGHARSFVSAYLGVKNDDAQPLVNAGVWEAPLLAQVIDWTLRALDVDRVGLVAASHGAGAAMDVAAVHPAVECLVLDSPLARPLELYYETARARGTSRDEAEAALVARRLPHVSRTFEVPARDGLETLALRPVPDVITDVCGFAQGARRVVEYAGPHAATMRHDAHVRGVPAACLDAIDTLETAQR